MYCIQGLYCLPVTGVVFGATAAALLQLAGAIRDMLNTSGMRASAGEIHGAFAGSFEFDWPQSELQ